MIANLLEESPDFKEQGAR